MSKKIFTTLLILISFTIAKTPVIETRSVDGFNWIQLDGSGNVTIIQGNEEKVIVTADKDLIENVMTEVSGRKLRLGLKSDWNWGPKSHSSVEYKVYVKNVSGVSVHGSGNIKADKLMCDGLDMNISGSGEIMVDNLKCDEVDVTISGSGECEVGGKTKRQSIVISGSGDFSGKQFASKWADVTISGSGDVTLSVEDELDVSVSGSGDVVFYGSPDVTEHISGSGDVVGMGSASY